MNISILHPTPLLNIKPGADPELLHGRSLELEAWLEGAGQ